MPSLGRVSPPPRKSSKRHVSRRPSSTCEPHPGSGDALPRIIVIIGVSFVTGFNERSTSKTHHHQQGEGSDHKLHSMLTTELLPKSIWILNRFLPSPHVRFLC